MSSEKNRSLQINNIIKIVKNNSHEFIGNNKIINITVRNNLSDIIWSHSSHYKITLKYLLNEKLVKKIMFAKIVSDAKKSFNFQNLLLSNYSHNCNKSPFPAPYHYDKNEKVLIMEYIEGKTLLPTFLLLSILRRTNKLVQIFTNVGEELFVFHNQFIQDHKNVNLLDIINNIVKFLEDNSYFNFDEKNKINNQLNTIAKYFGNNYEIKVTKMYNDWTLRNIIIENDSKIRIIDTEGAINPNYPLYEIIWNDIIICLRSIESQIKYAPLLNPAILKPIQKSFIAGYFKQSEYKIGNQEFEYLRYVTVLRMYLGMFVRPLSEVFTGIISNRYLAQLKKSLINGSGGIFQNII